MKKVISFSLWGKNSFYVIGAILNADIAEKEWPDWICRYYIAPSVPRAAVQELANRKNTEIFMTEEEEGWNGTFWRFYACSDPTVDVVIFRDTDSRLSIRDKAAVEQWLNSGKKVHIMRDHCEHGWPICAGTWGCRDKVLLNMIDLIQEYPKQIDNKHGNEQRFLSQRIYPNIVNDAYIHDDWFLGAYIHEFKHPFPIPRLRGDGWWNNKFPDWHSGTEHDIENYPSPCALFCPSCKTFHDNEYIGKQRYINSKDKEKYSHVLSECQQ